MPIIFLIFLLVSANFSFCEETQSKPKTSNNIETFELTSEVFKNTRSIRILLPPDYSARENRDKRYPVFYLNDGLMVFDPADRGIQIEKIVYDLYGSNTLPHLIFVGIDNGACTDKTQNEIRDRANEFLPYPDAGFLPDNTYEPVPPNPQGKLYPDFLLKEVMPEVNRRYRTLTGKSNTAIGGYSYGGVSALYTIISRPEIFGKVLLESTPLWIGLKHELLNDAEGAREWPEFIYIGKGSNETDDEAFKEHGTANLERLRKIITEKSPKTKLKIVIEEGASHSSEAWRKRLPVALRFLLNKPGNLSVSHH